MSSNNWWNTIPKLDFSQWSWESMSIPKIHENVIQFNVNRLADILAMTTKTLKERPEFQDSDVTITSTVSFGPIRLSVSIRNDKSITRIHD